MPTLEERPKKGSALREFLETVVGAVLLATLIITFVGRAFTVDGPSMLPTLHGGERLLVDKLTYRFRSPERGDIVVFRYPADPSHYFIKRVIGVPGDEVEILAGRVFVNGFPLVEEYVQGVTYGHHRRYVVPADHFFVLGDNRLNSQDSRSPSVGYVPRSLVIGRALIRYWPIDRLAVFEAPKTVQAAP